MDVQELKRLVESLQIEGMGISIDVDQYHLKVLHRTEEVKQEIIRQLGGESDPKVAQINFKPGVAVFLRT